MCGILGLISPDKISLDTIRGMRDTMVHRGPDGAGEKLLAEGRVALGHRRLSIIDLTDDASQPMTNEDHTVWLTYNGEIYNFLQLRRELLTAGHQFRSQTDSEVLVHGYEEWGIEGLLKRLRGMFAFSIYDLNKKCLYIARDRFGIKPLSYYSYGGTFGFASEIKALAEIPNASLDNDDDALADFFKYGYVPHPSSPFKQIRKLRPAHYMQINLDGEVVEHKCYWKLSPGNRRISQEQALEESQTLLRNAVQEHLISDVPLGIFLSGGYDSTSVLSHMSALGHRPDAYTLGFEGSENSEHKLAEEIASIYGATCTARVLSRDENHWQTMVHQAAFYDEPYAVSSFMPFYHVCEVAAKEKKVILGGDGGDEIFAGYRWHKEIPQLLRSRSAKSKLKDAIFGSSDRLISLYNNGMNGVRNRGQLESTLTRKRIAAAATDRNYKYFKDHLPANTSVVKALQILDINTFMLEACLMRADQTSMIHSLEVRLPFLDHRLVEYMIGLDEKSYISSKEKKPLLGRALKAEIPAHILDQPKRGFGFQQLDTLFNEDFKATMQSGELVKSGFIDKNVNWDRTTDRIKFHLASLELWAQRFGI